MKSAGRPDRLPVERLAAEHRAEREPERRQRERGRGHDRRRRWRARSMKRRRVTVSPSKAPGICRSSGVLRLCLLCVGLPRAPRDQRQLNAALNASRKRTVNNRDGRHLIGLRAADRLALAAAQRCGRAGSPGAGQRLGRLVLARRAPADAAAPAAQTACGELGVGVGVGLGDAARSRRPARPPPRGRRARPAATGRARRAGRRAAAPGRDRRSRDDPRRAVVQPRALEDHLEQQLVLGARGRARAARRRRAGPGPGRSGVGGVAARRAVERSASVPPWSRSACAQGQRSVARAPHRTPTSANASRGGARPCARRRSGRGPARGTRPRTATAAGTRRGRSSARHQRAVGLDVAAPRRRRSRATGASVKNTVSRPGTALDLRPAPPAAAAASRRPSASALGGRGQPLVGGAVEQRAAWPARPRPRAGCPTACPPGRRRRPARSAPSARAGPP